jgi:hypothetical protein
MAYAFDPDSLDPDLQLLKNSDNAWRKDLALIRKFTEEEKQAEADRAFAARLAGVTLNELSDNDRKMAMLLDDFDDDDVDDESEQTNMSLAVTNNTSTAHTITKTYSQPKP